MIRMVLGLLLLSLAIACGLALLASKAPDGLKYSMEKAGILEDSPAWMAPMPSYEMRLELSKNWRRILAGCVGALSVFGIVLVMGWILARAGTREGRNS